MTKVARNTVPGAGRVAILHARADQWALLIAERRAKLTVVEARSFRQGHETEVIAALAAAGASRLVRVAPGSQTIARTAEVPRGSSEEMNAATALLAEGTLPDDVPVYRRAAGLIPAPEHAPRSGSAAVLLTAWRNGTAHDDGVAWPDQRWTTEIVGLAFLCAGHGAGVYAPFGSGSLSLFAAGAGRCVARVLVESSADGQAWDAARARHLAQTCAAVGRSPAGFAVAGQSLWLSPEVIDALKAGVSGATLDGAWLDTYGIALGAALAATSPEPSSRRLTDLMPDAPTTRTPTPERLAAWLAGRRNAAVVVVLAVLLMFLAPLGLAWARLGVLTVKSAAVPDQDRVRDEIERRAALYRELDQGRWPMTKLWADISAAVPEGVSAEALRLSPDQGLSMQGTAETPELLTTLQKNLNSTGLFDKLKIVRSESTASGVSYDLSASVVSPHTSVKPIDDFAAKSLAVRLYGESAASSAGSSTEQTRAGSSGGDRFDRRGDRGDRGGRAERGDRGGRAEDPATARAPKPIEIPPELSDASIAAMDRATAMKEWVSRKGVAGKPGLDPAVKARLDAEIPKLQERMRQAASGGGA